MVNKAVVGAGIIAAMGVAAGAFMLSGQLAADRGAGTATQLPNPGNVPKNDQLEPVTPNEANRRATVNQEDATRAREAGKDYQAPTVITQVGPADRGQEPPAPPPTPPPAPEPVERVIKETTEKTVYVTRVPIDQPVNDAFARQAIERQLNALANPQGGGGAGAVMMVSSHYKAPPPPPEPPKPVPAQRSANAGPAPNTMTMLARTGDVIFARLDRGFNSDDPGAPIIVTLDDLIYDPASGTRAGPLTGMRLVGNISYSEYQSAISFNQLVTNTGQQFPITAIAISEETARTGVASKVDRHTLSRYAGLLTASLIQGAGQVATQLVANNRNVTVSDGVVVSGANPVNYWQAGVAALMPLGQNLSNVARQKFNRPATMTAPAGMGLGVVFLSPVVLPKGTK